MDATDVHDLDQTYATMREHAEGFARNVAVHYTTLINEGVPEALAERLTERFAAAYTDDDDTGAGVVVMLGERED